MVARGDLGVEIDVAQMPSSRSGSSRVCQRYQRPVIIATQMLDSMHDSPRPTRAEATDVANAILDGADACMLSGETAVGKFPREAVEMMNRIALATEASLQGRPPRAPDGDADGAARHHAGRRPRRPGRWRTIWRRSWWSWPATRAARRSRCRSIAASCRRWASARSEATLRQMCLYWGVTPLRGAPATRHAGADQARRRLGLPRGLRDERRPHRDRRRLAPGRRPERRRNGQRRARRRARARSRRVS